MSASILDNNPPSELAQASNQEVTTRDANESVPIQQPDPAHCVDRHARQEARRSIDKKRRTQQLQNQLGFFSPLSANNNERSRGLDDDTRPEDLVAQQRPVDACRTIESSVKKPEPRTGNCCFLCFKKNGQTYTTFVQFDWPGKWIDEEDIRKFEEEGSETKVMQAIKDELYRQQGTWKRWLWSYEILTAEEVKVSDNSTNNLESIVSVTDRYKQFRFDDIGENGRAQVQITRLRADDILKQALQTLDNPLYAHDDLNNICWAEDGHSLACIDRQKHDIPCYRAVVSEAANREFGYHRKHWLRDCLRQPQRAGTKRFLSTGLLQETFVYMSVEVSKASTP